MLPRDSFILRRERSEPQRIMSPARRAPSSFETALTGLLTMRAEGRRHLLREAG